ncbi:MAG: hypothetical protein IT241_08190 [Bacteroidia bacterium]|nr:hypothetical protein [Bacteroidia bacterium]
MMIKNKTLVLVFTAFLSGTCLLAGQVLLDGNGEGGFEVSSTLAGNGWMVANHSTNQWFIGINGAQSGARGAYISNNGGAGNNYTATLPQVSHFYRDITFPASGTVQLTFKWKSAGESLMSNPIDYLRIEVVATTITPVAGSIVNSGLLGAFNMKTSWQSESLAFCATAGVPQRLVISWINDGSSGANPAVCIDNIQIVLSPSGGPVNDLPCNAAFLPLNLPMSGNNTGASNCDEPPPPSCGNNWNNTVWYKFIAPPSGCVRIKTTSGTLVNTQLAIYSGICSSLMLLNGTNCNDDIPSCGFTGYPYRNSLLELNGLTSGVTYYVAVDGFGFETGSFSIIIYNACTNAQMPPVPGQDCELAIQVCSNTVNVPNPGYNGIGNHCDFSAGSNCLLQGEKGSVWFRIAITGSGFLAFDIVPNDYTSGCTGGAETDYDFTLYKVGGAGATAACGLLGVPLRCNYNYLGVTGLYANGNGNPVYGGACWNDSYEDTVGVQVGDVFLLCVSNWDITNSGFTLNISSSTPVSTTVPPGGTMVWTGTASSDWFNSQNWGGCQVPDCRINVLIPASLPRYPVISASGASVRTITINPDAGFGISSGLQFMICNDFNNNGNLSINPGATMLFQDTAQTAPLSSLHHQKLNGNLTGTNALGSIIVNKPAGYYVQAMQDLDVKGNFKVNGGLFGGEFRATGIYQKVSGDFIIDPTAPNPASYQSAATLEFNGLIQQYKNRGSINNVVMNQQPGGILNLNNHGASLAWMRMGITGNLLLQSGKIITGSSFLEVKNRDYNAITPGNNFSYIEGAVRKSLNQSLATGTYEFPVGSASKGYQRMSLEVTSPFPGSVDFITVNFENSVAANNTSIGSECGLTWHQAPASPLDNGFWKLQPYPKSAFTSGIITPVLWNQNFTNMQQGFTVQFNRSGINTASGWSLNPPVGSITCVNFPVTEVKRVGMSVNTVFANAAEVYFSTAQGVSPLPVAFMSLKGKLIHEKVELTWETAAEINNNFFEIQRSISSESPFMPIGKVNGSGTTGQYHIYHFDDFNLPKTKNLYYRIRQVDFDGSEYFSKSIKIELPIGQAEALLIPNPFNNSTRLILDSNDMILVLRIYHAGSLQLIKEIETTPELSVREIELSSNDFDGVPGVYLVRVVTTSGVRVLKAVLL